MTAGDWVNPPTETVYQQRFYQQESMSDNLDSKLLESFLSQTIYKITYVVDFN